MHHGGGDQGTLLSHFRRLEIPRFYGTKYESWIFAIQEYFDLLQRNEDQRLRVVGFNLEGAATAWFRWMSRNKLITSWEGFLGSVHNRFGPCKYEDPLGTLSKLLQTGTVAQYQSGKPPLLPTPIESTNTNTKPLAIKWISPEERQEQLNKGLCFNCDSKWMRGHKCPDKFLFHMAEEDDDPSHEIPADQAYYLEDKVNFKGEGYVTAEDKGEDEPRGYRLPLLGTRIL
uniref:Retrovirus-related Pol polyprotein from transposon opus n=1 Tax=Tanacetum cinerariifolium TaxID=118510 RepID=A0A699J1X9_TANCI|nr:retrovirus-related Pol polyprotein from transposon opus [Tanacetum cinerariifolium]